MTAAPRRARFRLLTLTLVHTFALTTLAAQAPAPESHFGFRMGSAGQLAAATAIETYFELVASRSDRVRIVDLGSTTGGHRTLAAIVSAPENIGNLDQIRATNQRLADPRTLSPEEARRLAGTHKAVLVIGCSIHASEIGATQAASELLHTLATSSDPETLQVLQNVVVILIPLLNPDGHRLVVTWAQTTKNTPFAGGPMPWLDHKYAGHDINRDGFMMNLAESRNLARFFYADWHPQVFLSMHQMESSGPRMFVPPVADPIDRNYDPLIWREAALLGDAMALELQREGRSGVVSNALYDYFWPGYEDSAPLGHNTVCLLAEVASPSVGRQADASAGEVRDARGWSADKPHVNYPDPWRGGPWTLRDVVDYDLTAVRGLLRAVSAYREPIVQNFYELGRRAIDLGRRGGPFAFIIPPEQYDPHAAVKLETLLLQGSIDIHRALEPFRADGEPYPAGSDIILLAQPYRAYVKTLLERQDYPAPRDPSRSSERPYDVAGWTLPAQMGVDVRTIERTFEPPAMSRLTAATMTPARIWDDRKPDYFVIDARGNGGAVAVNRLVAAGAKPSWLSAELEVNGYKYAPGSLVVGNSRTTRAIVEHIATSLGMRVDGARRKLPVAAKPLGAARVALYRPWLPNADEGWTRWLLEQHEFRFTSISDADVRAGDLRKRFDAIILPSASPEQLLSGNRAGTVPPEYTGGLGESGTAALKSFVDAGGTLICLDKAGGFAIDSFKLPLRDIVRDAGTDEFFCPGSILRVDLDPLRPLSYGMNAHTAGFFASSSAYEVIAPPATTSPENAVTITARYPPSDLLLSGWLEGEQLIAGKAAVVEVRVGTGRVILFGFATQHRGQSYATFRLLFNSIFTTEQAHAVR